MFSSRKSFSSCAQVFLCVFLVRSTAVAATPSELARDLKRGGYVVLMRHASAPMTLPDAASADAANPTHERQLDAQGREDAIALGAALRRLGIPIGMALTSPTYRARETAKLAGIRAVSVAALGEGAGMMNPSSPEAVQWLQRTAATAPKGAADTIIITHMPNIMASFPDAAKGLSSGEAIVLRPNGSGDTVIGRIKINEWPTLAKTD